MHRYTDVIVQFDSIQNTADWTWTTQTGIHKHTTTHLSIMPKVIKRSVNKLITSWQLPTKTDLRSPPSRLFLCPCFLFTLLCHLSPFLHSSSLFWLLQKVHSFPPCYLLTRTLCTIVLLAIRYYHFSFSHATISALLPCSSIKSDSSIL